MLSDLSQITIQNPILNSFTTAAVSLYGRTAKPSTAYDVFNRTESANTFIYFNKGIMLLPQTQYASFSTQGSGHLHDVSLCESKILVQAQHTPLSI